MPAPRLSRWFRLWLAFPLVVLATIAVMALLWIRAEHQAGQRPDDDAPVKHADVPGHRAPGAATPAAITATDTAPGSSASAPGGQPAAAEPDLVGSTPAVPGDANANVRSVVEAALSGTHPERLTPLIAPAPYDHQRFLANPQAYLDVVEPGRVFQSAQPGEGVLQLDLVGDAVATIPQGGHTTLRVRTVPLAPVTFTSFECGAFANRLTSTTVRADAQGIASAEFTAPPGTLNDVTILAGSPLASGQINFCVTVVPAVAQQAPAGD